MSILRARIPPKEPETEQGVEPARETESAKTTEPPVPRVEIERCVERGYLLSYVDENGWSFVETWHPSVEDAKDEAKRQFAVKEDDWIPVVQEGP